VGQINEGRAGTEFRAPVYYRQPRERHEPLPIACAAAEDGRRAGPFRMMAGTTIQTAAAARVPARIEAIPAHPGTAIGQLTDAVRAEPIQRSG
jgi:hypothetical protein